MHAIFASHSSCQFVQSPPRLDHEFSVKHSDCALVFADDVELLVWDVLRALVIFLGALAARSTAIALVV